MVFLEQKEKLPVCPLALDLGEMDAMLKLSLKSNHYRVLIFIFICWIDSRRSLIHLRVTCACVYTIEIWNGKALFQHAIRVNSIVGLYGGNCWLLSFETFFFICSHEVSRCIVNFWSKASNRTFFSAESVVMIMMRSFVIPYKFLRWKGVLLPRNALW